MRILLIIAVLALVLGGAVYATDDASDTSLSECLNENDIPHDIAEIAGDYSAIVDLSETAGENSTVRTVAECHARGEHPEKFVAVTLENGSERVAVYTINESWSTSVATGDMEMDEYKERVLDTRAGGGL